ncbi:conserved protein of unknown function [Methanocaldococcus lauensis]|uniref:Uncharacterized protein n=1 Tax=Methanocaldococcus lauensis TaxID=2546128 RepID=A0A8D6SYS0_9EURY|nr:hypothetical protein [Methanocaldococcus lauensis]CAB3289482.1 conserved protein of unknown function [Methanocaldococcus lauensis]CAB3289905.1 conserved protein of unknown function [Methanocaldococcus lauensis]
MAENDKKLLEMLKKIKNMRKKRLIIGSFLISTSIVLSQISVYIFVGIFDINIYIGLLLLFISLVFLAVGIYLIIYMPPIVIE